MTEPITLPGALAAEISRVTELRAQYEEAQRLVPSSGCRPAIVMMTLALDRAIRAAGSPDIAGQAHALAELKDFTG